MIWLDDRTLVFVDRFGLHRLSVEGIVEALPGFDPSELSISGSTARMAMVGDALAILTLDDPGPTGIARLTIIERDGSVALRESIPSWNPPVIVPDSNRRRALIVSDPQQPREPPTRISLLGEGTPPQPSPFERLEPGLSPSSTPATISAGLTGAHPFAAHVTTAAPN